MKTPLEKALVAAAVLLASPCARPAVPVFAKGADLSWTTELEARGYVWRNKAGKTTECFALMKSLGFNAVRLRVWVDPKDGWNAGRDLEAKAHRAAKSRMPVMLDFHYSDSWADPGKQFKPARWSGLDRAGLIAAIGEHTASVVKAVRATGAEVAWVQIGNEVRPGLLWDKDASKSGALRDVMVDRCLVAAKNHDNFAAFLNAGAAAVRKTCPRKDRRPLRPWRPVGRFEGRSGGGKECGLRHLRRVAVSASRLGPVHRCLRGESLAHSGRIPQAYSRVRVRDADPSFRFRSRRCRRVFKGRAKSQVVPRRFLLGAGIVP